MVRRRNDRRSFLDAGDTVLFHVGAGDQGSLRLKYSIEENHYSSGVVKKHSSGIRVPEFESWFHHLLVMILGKLVNLSVTHFFIYKMGLIYTS